MGEVIDKDLGWKRIVSKMRVINGKEIRAGVLPSAGNGKKGVPIAEYATHNEYGTEKIPSRPFMATSADENKGWNAPVKRAISGIIDGAEVISELNTVGKKMKDDIKKNVGTHRFKPLKPSTVKKKGHDIQLIDSGALYDAIDFEVK